MRIATTTLESFRLWRRGRIDEASLLASIRGDFTPTPRVLLGLAYDRILGDPDQYRVADGYACDGYRFEADTIEPALATIDRRGLCQAKATKTYAGHTVVTKVDHILGGRITEFKTRLGSYVVDKYAASYQWRFELDIFAATSVTYRVFRLAQDPIALKGIEELPLYGYPQLEADCVDLVEAFAGYVRRNHLELFLEPFVDSPTRPSRAARLRDVRDARSAKGALSSLQDEESGSIPGLRSTCTLQPLQPIAALPAPSLVLRSPRPRLLQPGLF